MDRLLIALVVLCVAVPAAWQVQDWRWGGKVKALELTHAKALQKADAEARAREQIMRKEAERVANESEKNRQALVARAARAESAAAGLRDEIARLNARRVPADPGAAAAAGEARAARELLGSCADRYQGVARAADELRDQVNGLQKFVAAVCRP